MCVRQSARGVSSPNDGLAPDGDMEIWRVENRLNTGYDGESAFAPNTLRINRR